MRRRTIFIFIAALFVSGLASIEAAQADFCSFVFGVALSPGEPEVRAFQRQDGREFIVIVGQPGDAAFNVYRGPWGNIRHVPSARAKRNYSYLNEIGFGPTEDDVFTYYSPHFPFPRAPIMGFEFYEELPSSDAKALVLVPEGGFGL
jgi:hypothetical protein